MKTLIITLSFTFFLFLSCKEGKKTVPQAVHFEEAPVPAKDELRYTGKDKGPYHLQINRFGNINYLTRGQGC